MVVVAESGHAATSRGLLGRGDSAGPAGGARYPENGSAGAPRSSCFPAGVPSGYTSTDADHQKTGLVRTSASRSTGRRRYWHPAAQTYAGLDLVARRLWQGGHQPQFHGAGNDRDTRAQEQLIDEYWASKLGKGKKLSEITPNPGSAEVPVPTVLTLLSTLEAMREAIMLYASYVPSLTLGQMQYLLHNLLRRQAGTKWTELLELCQEQPAIAWPEVTKRACAKLNVQTREEWEQVLTAFTRTSGQRELVLSEFAFRFRILAQASVFGTSPSDDSFLYEMLLRGAQVPGLVYWAQAKARSRGPAVVHDAYATVAQGFGYLTEWGKLSQDERDEAINKEATLSDKALTHLFKCLRGHAQQHFVPLGKGSARAGLFGAGEWAAFVGPTADRSGAQLSEHFLRSAYDESGRSRQEEEERREQVGQQEERARADGTAPTVGCWSVAEQWHGPDARGAPSIF